jgi:hypothetical protein
MHIDNMYVVSYISVHNDVVNLYVLCLYASVYIY